MPLRLILILLLLIPLSGTLGGCALNREKLAEIRAENSPEKVGDHLESIVDFLREPPKDPSLYAEAIQTGYSIAVEGDALRNAPTPYYMFHKELRRNFDEPDRSASKHWVEKQYSPGKVSTLISSWALLGLARLNDPDMLSIFVDTLGEKRYCTPTLSFQRAAAEGIDALIDHVTGDGTLRSTLLVKIAAARDCAEGKGVQRDAREALLRQLARLEERGTSLATFNSIFGSPRFRKMSEEEQLELLRMTYQLLNNQLRQQGKEVDPTELRSLLSALGDFALSGRFSDKVSNSAANTLFTVIPTYYCTRLLEAYPGRPDLFRLILLLRDQEEGEWRRAAEAGDAMTYSAGNKRPIFNPYPLFGETTYRSVRSSFDAVASDRLDDFLSRASDSQRSEMLALLLRDAPELLGTTLLKRMGKSSSLPTPHLTQEMAFVEKMTTDPARFSSFYNQIPVSRDLLLVASTTHPDAATRLPLVLPHYRQNELGRAAYLLAEALSSPKTPGITLTPVADHFIATLEKLDAGKEELPEQFVTLITTSTLKGLHRHIDTVSNRLLGYWQKKSPELALTMVLDAYFRPDPDKKGKRPEPEASDLLLLGKLIEHPAIQPDTSLYTEAKQEIFSAMERDNDEVALLATRLAYRLSANDSEALLALDTLTERRWSKPEEVTR